MINYRIEFDIAALILLFVVFMYYIAKKKNETLQSKIFVIYLLFAFLNIFVDILTVIGMRYYNEVPKALNEILNTLYLTMQFITPVFFLLYAMQIYSNKKEAIFNKKFYLFSVPAVICALIMIFVNPFTNIIFYFENGIYKFGPLHILIFINEIFYVIVSILWVIFHRSLIDRSKTLTLLSSIFIVVSLSFIQIIYKYELLAGYGIALSLLMIYISFQDPKDQIDSLTGALNKMTFSKIITDKLKKEKKFSAFGFALNNFTMINDTYGASVGDAIIVKVCKDVCKIAENNKIFRYGGDKFVFLADNDMEAKIAVDRILDYFNEPVLIGETIYYISARCAIVPQNQVEDFNFLIRQIDYAFKKVKEYEKTHFFTLTLKENEFLRKSLFEESKIGEAIDNNTFEMYLMPLYNSSKKQYTDAEALLRLYVEGYGFINPESIVSYAEKHNQMIHLGLSIIEKVFKILSENDLKKYGMERVHINLSITQCIDRELATEVVKLASKYKIDTTMVGFEITESQQIKAHQILLDNMNTLITRGFVFALDDYGTGYSTLDYILTLPFKTIKIDQRIVMKLMTNSESKTIISYTTKMLHSLNKEIVVEGVETEAIDEFVTGLNINYIQGYYHSKPLNLENFLKFITLHNKNMAQ